MLTESCARQNAHGGVALFWKHAFDDYITPLTNIHSDRIVGIKCDFDNSSPLYILSVYLPTSSQNHAREPNQRGLKLLELADYFNLCPVNLLRLCDGPTVTFISHCGRYRSTLDYIFVPNCLFNEVCSAKTFDLSVENTSDHFPL